MNNNIEQISEHESIATNKELSSAWGGVDREQLHDIIQGTINMYVQFRESGIPLLPGYEQQMWQSIAYYRRVYRIPDGQDVFYFAGGGGEF